MWIKGAHLRSPKELKEITLMIEKIKRYVLIFSLVVAAIMILGGIMLVASMEPSYMAVGFIAIVMAGGFAIAMIGCYTNDRFCSFFGAGIFFFTLGGLLSVDGNYMGQFVSVIGVAIASATFADGKHLRQKN